MEMASVFQKERQQTRVRPGGPRMQWESHTATATPCPHHDNQMTTLKDATPTLCRRPSSPDRPLSNHTHHPRNPIIQPSWKRSPVSHCIRNSRMCYVHLRSLDSWHSWVTHPLLPSTVNCEEATVDTRSSPGLTVAPCSNPSLMVVLHHNLSCYDLGT
jgi:hypothetical protein